MSTATDTPPPASPPTQTPTPVTEVKIEPFKSKEGAIVYHATISYLSRSKEQKEHKLKARAPIHLLNELNDFLRSPEVVLAPASAENLTEEPEEKEEEPAASPAPAA
jgi:hypothetical protein